MMKPQRGKTPGKKGPAPRPPRRLNSAATDPVEVFCRIRPVDPNLPKCVKAVSPTTVVVKPGEYSHSYKNGNVKESTYTFQHVFDEYTGQKAMFDHIALQLADDVVRGKNALLFAYGVTGSGKTHTMTGTPEEQGVLPRCLDVIFNSIDDLQAKKYVFKPDKMNGFDTQPEVDAMMERQRREIMPQMTNTTRTPRRQFEKVNRVRDPSKVGGVVEDNNYAVFVSYVEIYNNYIYDLLEELQYDPITGYKQPQSRILREDLGHNMYVNGVTEIEVKSTEEAYDVLIKGQKRRKVAHTALNTESSRSHSVFNIRLVQAPLDPVGEEVLQDKSKITTSQLSLCDLAGSERLVRTNNAKGDRLREAGNINQSLMVLRQCIEALRENQQLGRPEKMVPYRDSKVTLLFKNYFDGEGKVKMIVCVNPIEEEYDETIHVMKFAELTQEVQVARPQEHKMDVGLAPGRRRLNQKYKEAVAKAKEEGMDPASIPVSAHLVYSMGPSFPKLELKQPSDEYTLQNLMAFLKEREGRRFTLQQDLSKKEERFRTRLLNMEQENEEMKQRIAELESKVNGKESEMKRVMKRVNSLEKTKDVLTKTATVYERERRDLAREVDDKDWKIQREKLEKDRLKQDFRARMVLTEHQMNDQMAREKKKLVEETQARLQNKNRKLQMVKHILNGDTSDAESISSAGSFPTPLRPPRTTPRYATGGPSVHPARSEPDLTNIGGGPTSTPKPYHMRAKTAYSTNTINKAVPRTVRGGVAPPPTKPKPMVNPRYHRRSKSAHEIWLEHRPAGTVDTGTLSQPQMKKRKSVTELREKDTKRGASKYVLTHQEVDSEGDFATKLVKGDIMHTAGGGTAVIFNDVEVIKQKSPGDRKRRSYEQLRPEDYSGEWSDPEDRCRIAIEGHGHMKRVKTSQV